MDESDLNTRKRLIKTIELNVERKICESKKKLWVLILRGVLTMADDVTINALRYLPIKTNREKQIDAATKDSTTSNDKSCFDRFLSCTCEECEFQTIAIESNHSLYQHV